VDVRAPHHHARASLALHVGLGVAALLIGGALITVGMINLTVVPDVPTGGHAWAARTQLVVGVLAWVLAAVLPWRGVMRGRSVGAV
jgi:hypothetical protein